MPSQSKEKYPSFIGFSDDVRPSNPMANIGSEKAERQISPPVVRINALPSLNNTFYRPIPTGGSRKTDSTKVDLEVDAMKALYPLVFHLEKEKNDVEEKLRSRSITPTEKKSLQDKYNILDKKVFTIHELLELLN